MDDGRHPRETWSHEIALWSAMTPSMLRQLVTYAVAVGAAFAFTRQCRKPKWLLGRLVLAQMNAGHSGLTAWGLSHLEIQRNSTVLDVGCGGGRTIATIADTATMGRVHGVDYSPASVAASRAYNAGRIAEGRVDVQEASVSNLPFPPSTFDIVTAIETHYYWPHLSTDLLQVGRQMRPVVVRLDRRDDVEVDGGNGRFETDASCTSTRPRRCAPRCTLATRRRWRASSRYREPGPSSRCRRSWRSSARRRIRRPGRSRFVESEMAESPRRQTRVSGVHPCKNEPAEKPLRLATLPGERERGADGDRVRDERAKRGWVHRRDDEISSAPSFRARGRDDLGGWPEPCLAHEREQEPRAHLPELGAQGFRSSACSRQGSPASAMPTPGATARTARAVKSYSARSARRGGPVDRRDGTYAPMSAAAKTIAAAVA